MGAVFGFIIGLVMFASSGWFIFTGLRDGHIDLGSARTGSWSAELREEPVQFGCITLVWVSMAALGAVFVAGSVLDMAWRYYPLALSLLLVPWSFYSSWYRLGGPAEAYLHEADAALRRSAPEELQSMATRIPSAALCRLIGEAGKLQLETSEPSPRAEGYREAHDPNERLQQRVIEALNEHARRQRRRLAIGWSVGWVALLPIPVLWLAGKSWDVETSAYGVSLLVLGVFALSSRHWWRARALLVRAPEVLAEAAIEGGTLAPEPDE